jgi:hypothetical protein
MVVGHALEIEQSARAAELWEIILDGERSTELEITKLIALNDRLDSIEKRLDELKAR